MKLYTSDNLKELAKKFKDAGGTLYIVGGYIRNSILDKGRLDDVDLAGDLTLERAEKCAIKAGFRFQVVNKHLGTALFTRRDESYEYSVFRREKYGKGGHHTPVRVDFITDIKEDSERRDYTVNAMYYNILTEELIDFYNGYNDTKHRVLATVLDPQKTLSHDGTRILRLIRFAGELHFKVDKMTMQAAVDNAKLLLDVSKELAQKELYKIAVSDSLERATQIMDKIGVWYYLLGLNRNFTLDRKLVKAVSLAPYNWTLEMFLSAILYTKLNGVVPNGSSLVYNVETLYGEAGLKCSNQIKSDIVSLTPCLALFLNSNDMAALTIKYLGNEEKFSKVFDCLDRSKHRKLQKYIEKCRIQNKPLSINELKLTSLELMQVVDSVNINPVKAMLLHSCLSGKIKNERKELLAEAAKVNKILNKNK